MNDSISDITIASTIPSSSKKHKNPEPANKNSEWNEKLEQAVKDIGEIAKSYKIMHLQEAQKCSRTYNILMIFGIITGPLSSVFSGIGAAINPCIDPRITIIAIVIGFLSGIIVSIVKFGKYDESSNANKQAAARYTSIENNVRRQLSLYSDDRAPASTYMEWLQTKYDELFLSAPLLSTNSYEKYAEIAKKYGLPIPSKYDNFIEINSVYNENEMVNLKSISINIQPSQPQSQPNKQQEKTRVENSEIKSPTQTIKRSSSMAQFPELNQYSDKMLQYELKRMVGM